jgi:hypothetical protein
MVLNRKVAYFEQRLVENVFKCQGFFQRKCPPKCIYFLSGSAQFLYVVLIKALATSRRASRRRIGHVFNSIPFVSHSPNARRLFAGLSTIQGDPRTISEGDKSARAYLALNTRPVPDQEIDGGVVAIRITGSCRFGNHPVIERCSRSSGRTSSIGSSAADCGQSRDGRILTPPRGITCFPHRPISLRYDSADP